MDGTPWSFVVALNDSAQYEGGGTYFVHNDITCRPHKAGSCVIFSGKNLHEGLGITKGVRYILTGFVEYSFEGGDDDYDDEDLDCVSQHEHEAFLREYDSACDGFAAGGGVRTGDVVRGEFDQRDELHLLS